MNSSRHIVVICQYDISYLDKLYVAHAQRENFRLYVRKTYPLPEAHCVCFYNGEDEILKTTTSTILSFEGIRKVVLEIGKKIAMREKEEIELNKKGQLIPSDKEVVALFEEADGIFINLQGKDRKEAINKQLKRKDKEEEHLQRRKVKKELKLHVMYEGWEQGDNRHSLVNKRYIAGMMKSKEIAKLRDARVYGTYKEEEI